MSEHVKIIQDLDNEVLLEAINKLLEEDKNWSLITVDTVESRSLGVGKFLHTAWLQYNA